MEVDKKNLVISLRKSTGLSMSDCLKVLKEADWDIEIAKEKIADLSASVAMKKQDRETKNGGIIAFQKDNHIYFAKLLCETDFVCENDRFQNLCQSIINQLQIEMNFDFTNMINEVITIIGEKIVLEECGVFEGQAYFLYSSNGKDIGTILSMISTNQDTPINRDICKNIVAMSACSEEPINNIEDLMKQKWFMDESKTVGSIMKEHNILIKDFKLLII